MSISKKALSCLLALILFITSLSAGLHGLAAGLNEQELYDDLAGLMMNDYVAKRSNYRVESVRDTSMEGWSDEANLFKSRSTVKADDDKDGSIYHAALKFFDVFEHEVSYDYGQGSFDKQTMQKTIASKLATRMSEEEYDTYNIDAILDYFLASANVINAGSWFYEFIFHSKTTVVSALMAVDSIDDITENWVDIYECKITYTFKREWDENTATKAQYSYKIVEKESSKTGDTDSIGALKNAAAFFASHGAQLWNQEPFAAMTDAELINWRGSYYGQQFMMHFDTLSQYEADIIFHLFGDRIGDIMHLHGNTQPLSQMPLRQEVRKNPDGTVASYQMTPAKMNQMVYNIDGLLQTEKIGSLMPLLIDELLDDFEGNIGSITNVNILLGELIKGLLYNDDIINMILKALFPLIAEELYQLKFDISGLGTLDLGDSDILAKSLDRSKCHLLPGLFADNVLTGDRATKYAAVKAELKRAHNVAEDKKYAWDEVDWDNMVWGIDDKESLAEAFSITLGALGRFLRAVLCGGQHSGDSDNWVSLTITGLSTAAYIKGRNTFSNLIIPLFEVLGVPQEIIKTHDEIRNLNAEGMARAIIDPLLDWIEGTLLPNPIETVCNILPNLVVYLDKDTPYSPYRLLTETNKDADFSLNFPIVLQVVLGIPITAYHLEVSSFLKDDLKNALSGINSILQEFVKLKIKEPVFDANSNPVYEIDEKTGEIVLDDDGNPVQAINVHEAPLPYLMEKKIRACGVYEPYTSKSTTLPGGAMRVRVENPGNTLLYIFRFLFSSLLQRPYDTDTGTFSDYCLADAFGLDLDDELIEGIVIGNLITNIVFNYDEAICALIEFFARNETGYEYDHRKSPTSKEFTYKPQKVNYYNDVLLGRESKQYGPAVKYSENWSKLHATKVERNLDPLIEDVLAMLKLEEVENLNQFLSDTISDLLYTNDMLSNLADMLYGDEGYLSNLDELISGDKDLGFNLTDLLKDVLDVDLNPVTMGVMLGKRLFGNDAYHSEVSAKLRSAPQEDPWSSDLFYSTDGEGEKVARDWGFEDASINKKLGGHYKESEIFAINLGALLSPLAFVFRFLFLGEHIELLDLISIAGYPGYQYSLIHLYEVLGVGRQDLLTYKQYFEASYDEDTGNLATIEHFVLPLLKLVDGIIEDPLNSILTLIPNLFFAFSTGTLNDILNNLLHPVYVLVDILRPILDAYPILDNLLAGIDLGGVPLAISIPLDVDFNILLNNLLEGLLPDALTFDVDGTELTLHLPFLDTVTLATGTVYAYDSAAEYETVRLRSAGADIITVLVRYIVATLFLPENRASVKTFLVGWRGLDNIDDRTLTELFDLLAGMVDEDMVLKVFYTLFMNILPITGELSSRFLRVDFSLIEFFEAIGEDNFSDMLQQLLAATDTPNAILSGFAKLIETLKEFFNKIILFFQNIFPG